MKKILFGVSDTNECRRAVDCLIKLFSGVTEFEITLLRVVSEVLMYAESGVYDYNDIASAQNIESDDLLNEFENKFLKHNIEVSKVIKRGNAADILLDLANDHDLLVIGESESSILHRIFNSHQDLFISASPIPVLIAK
ncbi:universal stress protein [Helicobacter sp. MIT 14-3879]|uniref:universal stress protein n=1 Tax=Helicobacter sp. MIT 14-3879 TaxID=2040649 RepID=UPI000E1F3754|nr:universal stress protein [Helicobacter sp. MIT 14-3879]RDU63521.1 universal stress protein [Helicobacter sp. MIT 14-3879]